MLTAWELYDIAGADKVADALNKAFERCVAKNQTRQEVNTHMINLMAQYSKYGADDYEPRRVLHKLLNTVFGLER
jgi:hypothetical protein